MFQEVGIASQRCRGERSGCTEGLKAVWYRKAAVEKGEAGQEGMDQISKDSEDPDGLYPKDNGQEGQYSIYSMA